MKRLGLTAAAVLLSSVTLHAATYTVDTTTDEAGAGFQVCSAAPNDCSLRGAVIKANTDAVTDTISIPSSATPYDITIPNGGVEGFNNTANNSAIGDLDIEKPLVIQGGGADSTTVRVTGTGDDRIFHAPLDFNGLLEISGLTLTGGKPGANGRGGAIMIFGNNNSLKLTDAIIKDNQTTDAANGPGGGLSFENNGTLTISNVTFSGNSAAGDRGGALFFETGDAIITNSTFFDNSAVGLATDDGGGGAIDHSTGDMTIINSTFVKNSVATAGSVGGGIRGASGGTGVLKIKNSLFVDNDVSGANQNCGLKAGANSPVSQGHNISNDNTCTANFLKDGSDLNGASGTIVAVTLSDNGGPTPTLLLSSGSVAIDFVPAADCTDDAAAPLTEDQRGSGRPEDGDADGTADCDAGAVEIEAVPAGTTGGTTGGATTGGTAGTGGSTAGGDSGGGCSLVSFTSVSEHRAAGSGIIR